MERNRTPMESAQYRRQAIEVILQNGVSSIKNAERLIDEYLKLGTEMDTLRRQSQFYSLADKIDNMHLDSYEDRYLPVSEVAIVLRQFVESVIAQLHPDYDEKKIAEIADKITVTDELLNSIVVME